MGRRGADAFLWVAPFFVALAAGCGPGTSHDAPVAGIGGGAGAGGGGAGPGSGGGGGTGAGGGTGGVSPNADCAGLAINQSGSLDLDIPAISVTGKVTLDGAALPNGTGSRGRIVFVAASGRSTLTADLGSTGAGSYSLRLPPATYDVTYLPDSTQCAPGATPTPAMPCSGGVLAHGAKLSADGVLDVDIPTASVSGAVTLAGAAFPTGSGTTNPRGTISFAGAAGTGSAGTVAAVFSLGTSAGASYQGKLVRGSYDVSYNGNASLCVQQGGATPAAPCNSGALKKGIAITASGTLDLDVPIARVSGKVTLSGAALPTETGNRGSLSFVGAADSGLGAASSATLGTSGAGSYSVALLPGTYDVVYAANGALCTATAISMVPCVGGRVVAAAHLTADGTLDVDLQAVTVSGAVTVRGAAMPTTTSDRGRLSFVGMTGGAGTTPSFGTSGAASYRLRVMPGTYDVSYVPLAGKCMGATASAPPAMPCNTGRLKAGVGITADGVLDIDIPVAAVSGRVTLQGQPVPTATSDRGALTLVARDAGNSNVLGPAFGTSGAVSYGFAVIPGVYDVGFIADAGLCAPGAQAPAIPCVGGTVSSAANLTADGTLDVDIRAVAVTGAVKVNGAALNAATTDRGSIVFERTSIEGGGNATIDLGTSTAASYAVTLVPGRYVVSHAANAAACTGTSAAPQAPCASQALLGCN
jgi:hypothetical protein